MKERHGLARETAEGADGFDGEELMSAPGQVNAEMEHQTARDTTTGAPEPLGTRGGPDGRHHRRQVILLKSYC